MHIKVWLKNCLFQSWPPNSDSLRSPINAINIGSPRDSNTLFLRNNRLKVFYQGRNRKFLVVEGVFLKKKYLLRCFRRHRESPKTLKFFLAYLDLRTHVFQKLQAIFFNQGLSGQFSSCRRIFRQL